jgi:hypothetical protein
MDAEPTEETAKLRRTLLEGLAQVEKPERRYYQVRPVHKARAEVDNS